MKTDNYKFKKTDAQASSVIAKTIAKGIAGVFNINIKIKDKDLEKIYKTVDFSKTLLVLEDLERSKIDIFSVLGYVNSLTENDGAKVLLVANEKEIIQKLYNREKKDSAANSEGDESVNNDYNVRTYLIEKEKTVGDTISFNLDKSGAIYNIIKKYKLMGYFDDEKKLCRDICDIMFISSCNNLRALKYACQKTLDIFNYCGELDKDFMECIFYSIIFYSFKTNRGIRPLWTEGDKYSSTLGNSKYPLFKFCYDYIVNQKKICEKDVSEAQICFKELRKHDFNLSSANDNYSIISSWWLYDDETVIATIKNLEKDLKNNAVPYDLYGKIAHYITAIKSRFGDKVDIDSIKDLLVCNLKGKANEISPDLIRLSATSDEDGEFRFNVRELINKMENSLVNYSDILDFDYTPEAIEKLCTRVKDDKARFINNGGFLINLDIKKMIALFFKCSPSQMECYRRIFHEIYAKQDVKFLSNDKPFLLELKDGISAFIESEDVGVVKTVHAKWLIDMLNQYTAEMEDYQYI